MFHVLGFLLSTASATPALAPRGNIEALIDRPLTVDGAPVSPTEIRRHLIYAKGQLLLHARFTCLAIQEELRARAAETVAERIRARPDGEPPDPAACVQAIRLELTSLEERFMPSNEDVARERAYEAERFRSRFPTLDHETEIRRSYGSAQVYDQYLRARVYFERVLLPADPDQWPTFTLEALRADSGETVIEDAHQTYAKARQLAAEEGGEVSRRDRLHEDFLRQVVREALLEPIAIQTAIEGIPADDVVAVVAADGQRTVWTTSELWREVAPILTREDVREARTLLATLLATEQRLERDGFWPLGEPEGRDSGSVVPEKHHSPIAPSGLAGFPSNETHTEYRRLLAGFQVLISAAEQDHNRSELLAQLGLEQERAEQSLAGAWVNSEALLVSAFDFPRHLWKRDGWRVAEARARALRAELDVALREASYNVDPWGRAMDEHNDWWEPPAPLYGTHCIIGDRGRLGRRTLDELAGLLDESPYTSLLRCDSIAEHVLFDQPVGTVAGPFRGQRGFYLTRVARRGPPLHAQRAREKARELAVQTVFADYAHAALDDARVIGLDG